MAKGASHWSWEEVDGTWGGHAGCWEQRRRQQEQQGVSMGASDQPPKRYRLAAGPAIGRQAGSGVSARTANAARWEWREGHTHGLV